MRPTCACGSPALARVANQSTASTASFLCEECVVLEVRAAYPRGQLLDIQIRSATISEPPPSAYADTSPIISAPVDKPHKK